MARTNGGIIGKRNLSSFEGGLGSTTTKNSSGNITVQPGTRRVQALIVAGGGGGGNSSPLAGGMGGGGAGGYRCVEIVYPGGTIPVTVGAGGAGGNDHRPHCCGGGEPGAVSYTHLTLPTTPYV